MKYFEASDHRGMSILIILLLILLLILLCCLKKQMEKEHEGILAAIHGGPWIIDETQCTGQHHEQNPNWLLPGDEVYLSPLKVIRGGTEETFFNTFVLEDKIGSKTWYKFPGVASGSTDTHDHCVLFSLEQDRLKIYAQEVGSGDECGPHPSNQYPTAQQIADIDSKRCDLPHEGGWQGGP